MTGGGILEAVFSALAPRAEALDWSAVHVWWGDERYVAGRQRRAQRRAGDVEAVRPRPDRPAAAAPDAGLRRRVSPTPRRRPTPTPRSWRTRRPRGRACRPSTWSCSGSGPDGHCASLFPGYPGTKVDDRWVIAVHDSPKPPPDRLSLTFPALDAAAEVWFVVSGDKKADAVAKALGGQDVPSAHPHGREATRWLLDEAAAVGQLDAG